MSSTTPNNNSTTRKVGAGLAPPYTSFQAPQPFKTLPRNSLPIRPNVPSVHSQQLSPKQVIQYQQNLP